MYLCLRSSLFVFTFVFVFIFVFVYIFVRLTGDFLLYSPGAQCLAPTRAPSGTIIPPTLSFTLFRQVISFLLICAIEPRFWCVRCPEDEIRYCHRASIVAVSTKAQQMMIFARTKPRGIVNDTHNNQRITEPNMVKDFKRALISRGIFQKLCNRLITCKRSTQTFL